MDKPRNKLVLKIQSCWNYFNDIQRAIILSILIVILVFIVFQIHPINLYNYIITVGKTDSLSKDSKISVQFDFLNSLLTLISILITSIFIYTQNKISSDLLNISKSQLKLESRLVDISEKQLLIDASGLNMNIRKEIESKNLLAEITFESNMYRITNIGTIPFKILSAFEIRRFGNRYNIKENNLLEKKFLDVGEKLPFSSDSSVGICIQYSDNEQSQMKYFIGHLNYRKFNLASTSGLITVDHESKIKVIKENLQVEDLEKIFNG